MNTPAATDHATTVTATAGRVCRLIRKELSEILRDRRTITTLVLMPLLLYPLLSITFQQFLLASALDRADKSLLVLGFPDREQEQQFLQLLLVARQVAKQKSGSLPDDISLADLGIAQTEHLPHYLERLAARHIDLGIALQSDAEPDGQPLGRRWNLHYLPDSLRSLQALHEIERRLQMLNNTDFRVEPAGEQVRIRIEQRGILPIQVHSQPIEREETTSYFPLATLIPLILILMTITGAVYPAIDLTAGERERGTLEILVAAPVPRIGLLFAKYVSVLTVAILTALVNLAMMTITVEIIGLGEHVFGAEGLSALLVLEIFGLLLLFAAFFSAVLLAITSFARSFKEAQAYLIPLMLVSLAPGVAGMVPGIRLSASLALVPLLNIVLLGRDLLQHEAVPVYAALVIGSTLIYAASALSVAARIFGAEDVLYKEQTSWADLLRRPAQVRPVPSLSSALLCLCLMFFLNFLLQGLLAQAARFQQMPPEALVLQHVLMIVLSVLIFAGLPLLAAHLRHLRLSSTFLLRPASPLLLFAALVLGLALWPLLLDMLQGLQLLGWTSLTPELEKELETYLRQIRQEVPLGLVLLARVVPALVEELFFRGFLFTALQKITTPLVTIALSALLFGLFHLAASAAFGLERFIPSTVLGLILGWVCWKSQSVFPSMLLHACHNAASIWFEYAHGGSDELPLVLRVASLAGLLLGVLLLCCASRPEQNLSPLHAGNEAAS